MRNKRLISMLQDQVLKNSCSVAVITILLNYFNFDVKECQKSLIKKYVPELETNETGVNFKSFNIVMENIKDDYHLNLKLKKVRGSENLKNFRNKFLSDLKEVEISLGEKVFVVNFSREGRGHWAIIAGVKEDFKKVYVLDTTVGKTSKWISFDELTSSVVTYEPLNLRGYVVLSKPLNLTYYLTTSPIDAIKIVTFKNDYVVTFYYPDGYSLLKSKEVKYKKENIIGRHHKNHMEKFHKFSDPYNYHIHLFVEKEEIREFILEVLQKNKASEKDVKRIIESEQKNQKFEDGSSLKIDEEFTSLAKIKKSRNSKRGKDFFKYHIIVQDDFKNLGKFVKEKLEERGNWVPYKKGEPKSVDFLFVKEGEKSGEAWNFRAKLKNGLKSEEMNKIAAKDNLYKNLIKTVGEKEYLLETYYYNKGEDLKFMKNKFSKDNVWIIKPVGNFSKGEGIKVVKDFENLKNYFQKFNIKSEFRTRFVIQEYILNPLTFKQKKFHIRTYMIMFDNETFIYKSGYIFTSRLKYRKGDFENSDIHDSHGESTDSLYLYPEDMPRLSKTQKESVFKQMCNIGKDIGKTVKRSCYVETRKCYQIIGMDLMITENLEVKLLEMARRYGVLKNGEVPETLGEMIQGSFITVLDTIFPPENPPDVESKFMKI